LFSHLCDSIFINTAHGATKFFLSLLMNDNFPGPRSDAAHHAWPRIKAYYICYAEGTNSQMKSHISTGSHLSFLSMNSINWTFTAIFTLLFNFQLPKDNITKLYQLYRISSNHRSFRTCYKCHKRVHINQYITLSNQ